VSETIQIGSLLIPNEYMVRNSNYTFGIVMGVKDDLWGPSYRVLLSQGFDKWISHETILNLFEVHKL
jgi:hypothetical protein